VNYSGCLVYQERVNARSPTPLIETFCKREGEES
jgi:hypothetical protein